MNDFFDAKFYHDAMISVFSCQLQKSGRDTPKLSQKRLGGSSKSNCQRFRENLDLATEQPVSARILHCAAKSSYIPTPILGWTSDEQLSLIAATKIVPSERSLINQHCGWTEAMAHHKKLELISEQLPNKSLQECERCLRHLEDKRVAFFGQHQR